MQHFLKKRDTVRHSPFDARFSSLSLFRIRHMPFLRLSCAAQLLQYGPEINAPEPLCSWRRRAAAIAKSRIGAGTANGTAAGAAGAGPQVLLLPCIMHQ